MQGYYRKELSVSCLYISLLFRGADNTCVVPVSLGGLSHEPYSSIGSLKTLKKYHRLRRPLQGVPDRVVQHHTEGNKFRSDGRVRPGVYNC